MQLFVDEVPVGPEVDLYSADAKPLRDATIGTMNMEQGLNNLMFKIVGKSDESKGLGFDLTNIICERVE